MNALTLLAADSVVRTTFQWGRIRAPEDWLLPIAVTALLLGYVWWMYRRDTRALHPALSLFLVLLRTLTFIGLLAVWLQPQWRNEEDVVTPSRVVVLVDSSLSMAEAARDAAPGAASAPAVAASESAGIAPGSRSAEALRLLKSPLLDEIAPRGAETRLGEALAQTLFDQRAAPLSGIVLLSDGGQNTGVEPLDALTRARLDHLPVPPIEAVGLGSSEELKNVRIQDVAAPARTYPNDEFGVKAYLQAQGMAGRTVTVELTWREATAGKPDANAAPKPPLAQLTKQVALPADGKPIGVDFTLKPTQLGRTTVQVSIKNPPADDHNKFDNVLDADVEISERRNKILLFASAATREYQFLRNQLQRILRSDGSKDKEFIVDIYLQTGSEGISQDSSEILPDFPETGAALFDYDCIIAFDPDWRRLTPAQSALLKEWVADKAGGLILVAGRIFTDITARDPALSTIRSLYPVEFGRIFASAGDQLNGTSEPWQLAFTPEGRKSEFLRLADTEAAGLDAWESFPGFYDCYPAKSIKEKSVVLAGLQDPRAPAGGKPNAKFADDGRPYFLVEHAVGAGRVLYVGSGEFWRLRTVNSGYFTRLYTQFVRHVAQARLLRGSKRGVLMVDHDNGRYVLNDIVEVRAQLMDAQAKPLKATDVPLEVSAPDRTSFTVKLQADPALPGNFRGLFPVRLTGPYRLDLVLPDGDRDLLTRRLQVRVPNKESDDVRLNAVLLRRLAEATGGAYYEGVDGALAGIGSAATPAAGTPAAGAAIAPPTSLVSRLLDKTRITPRLARPVSLWDNQWTMIVLCSLMCLEWLIRRLVKLA
ncbi:MAG: hypothetical protein K8U03_04680 [Planctomycetia bacterium]|nr:hypothetical protein [Planctomycetia bacterium]